MPYAHSTTFCTAALRSDSIVVRDCHAAQPPRPNRPSHVINNASHSLVFKLSRFTPFLHSQLVTGLGVHIPGPRNRQALRGLSLINGAAAQYLSQERPEQGGAPLGGMSIGLLGYEGGTRQIAHNL